MLAAPLGVLVQEGRRANGSRAKSDAGAGPGETARRAAVMLKIALESPRGVAQSGSARALGARRRGFKSRLPDPLLEDAVRGLSKREALREQGFEKVTALLKSPEFPLPQPRRLVELSLRYVEHVAFYLVQMLDVSFKFVRGQIHSEFDCLLEARNDLFVSNDAESDHRVDIAAIVGAEARELTYDDIHDTHRRHLEVPEFRVELL